MRNMIRISRAYFFLICITVMLNCTNCNISVVYKDLSDSYLDVICVTEQDSEGITLDVPFRRNDKKRRSDYTNSEIIENFESFETNILYDGSNYWKVVSSTDSGDLKFLPIIDYRWEKFPDSIWDATEIFERKYVTPLEISFSVKLFGYNRSMLQIYEANEVLYNISVVKNLDEAIEVDENECILETKNRWLHFTTTIRDDVLEVQENSRINCNKSLNGSTDFIQFYSEDSESVWKLHKYKYLLTTSNNSTLKFKKINSGLECLGMYLVMCSTCFLNITLSRNEDIKKVRFTTDEGNKWEFFQVCADGFNGNISNDLTLEIKADSLDSDRIFWAIDDIILISKTGARTLTYSSKDINPAACENIYSGDKASLTKIRGNYTNQCNINITTLCDKKCTVCCKTEANKCYSYGSKENNVTEEDTFNNGRNISDTEKENVITTTVTVEIEKELPRPAKLTTSRTTITTTTEMLPEYNTTESPETEVTTKGNIRKESSFNYNYLYLLFLLIPLTAIVIISYRCYANRTILRARPVKGQQELGRPYEPSWIFKNPPESSDDEDRLSNEENDVSMQKLKFYQ